MIKPFIASLLVTLVSSDAVFGDEESSGVLQRIGLNSYQLGLQKSKMLPNQIKPLHAHTGPEIVYVLSGEVTILVKKDGASMKKTYGAGESFQHKSYEEHATKAGPDGAVVLASWVVEVGRNLAAPVE